MASGFALVGLILFCIAAAITGFSIGIAISNRFLLWLCGMPLSLLNFGLSYYAFVETRSAAWGTGFLLTALGIATTTIALSIRQPGSLNHAAESV